MLRRDSRAHGRAVYDTSRVQVRPRSRKAPSGDGDRLAKGGPELARQSFQFLMGLSVDPHADTWHAVSIRITMRIVDSSRFQVARRS